MSEPRIAPGAVRRATGITAAEGFSAAGVHCGIRKAHSDLALIASDREASAAAVFTRNRVVAAPIVVARECLERSAGIVRAIVVNSGNANACTGSEGLAAARRTVAEVARLLGLPETRVLVASTGVIGQRLPVERLVDGLPHAVAALSIEGGADAAEAILTTDTRTKESVRRVVARERGYVVGGMAKGSGMIHPDMATTLGFVTTDAAVPPATLRACLGRAIEASFNRISVDGDTSTNDMVAVLANGASGVEVGPGEIETFEDALTGVLVDLAKAVARDGEGATKLIEVDVRGARDDADALRVARTVAGSPLVKTAVHGADANWGRIVAAAGRAGAEVDPETMRVAISGVEVLRPGFVSEFSEDEARTRMLRDTVVLEVDLGLGEGRAVTWTCDLTHGYVDINASYRT